MIFAQIGENSKFCYMNFTRSSPGDSNILYKLQLHSMHICFIVCLFFSSKWQLEILWNGNHPHLHPNFDLWGKFQTLFFSIKITSKDEVTLMPRVGFLYMHFYEVGENLSSPTPHEGNVKCKQNFYTMLVPNIVLVKVEVKWFILLTV